MPKSTTKGSGLSAKIAKRNAREAVRYKEAEAPKANGLPPGIEGGIAKITKINFPVAKTGDNKGEPMLYMHGTCVEPKEFTYTPAGQKREVTVKLEGAMVQLRSIPLCDTKDGDGNEISFEEQLAKAENQLKLAGIDTSEIDDDEYEETLIALPEEVDVYFRFRTWAGKPTEKYPNPRVNVTLEGPADDYEPEEIDDMDDHTEEPEEEEEEAPAPKTKSKPATKATPKKTTPAKSTKAPAKPTKAPAKKSVNWDAVAAKADNNDDEEAQTQIHEEAKKHKVDSEKYDSWREVLEACGLLEAAATPGDEDGEYEDADTTEADEEEDAADIVPEKEEIYLYTPDGEDEAVECEVTRVVKAKKTVNLTSIEDDSVKFAGVPWSRLSID